MQDLLKDTNTASALALIGQLCEVKVSCIGAESVHQNCVIGERETSDLRRRQNTDTAVSQIEEGTPLQKTW